MSALHLSFNDISPNGITTELTRLEEGVGEFVRELFDTPFPYPSKGHGYKDGKVIRDAVFDLQRFPRHEMEIIDSPVLQRLRGIHQTAMAYMVYPSAHHKRFDHSLGVAIMAGRIVHSLRLQGWEISSKDEGEIRLAALLHDSGHCAFSHLSESIIEDHFRDQLDHIRVQLEEVGLITKQVNFGELFSFFIVRSERFRRFWDSVRGDSDIDLDNVADLIVGQAPTKELSKRFKADIISSAFDADKLDYFARDAHSSGVKVTLDTERILHAITLVTTAQGTQALAVKRTGIPHVEQILLGRTMLYSSIYHHHKVRAIECMVRGVFERIWAGQADGKFAELGLNEPWDFLRITESDFFTTFARHPLLAEPIAKLQRRQALKRVLILNSSTVLDPSQADDKSLLFDFLRYFDQARVRHGKGTLNPSEYLLMLRNVLFDALPPEHRNGRSVHDLWVDIPSSKPLSPSTSAGLVEMQPGGEQVSMYSVFPSDAWLRSYQQNKWNGHVFFDSDDEKVRKSVGYFARLLLKERLPVTISDQAISMCLKNQGDQLPA